MTPKLVGDRVNGKNHYNIITTAYVIQETAISLSSEFNARSLESYWRRMDLGTCLHKIERDPGK